MRISSCFAVLLPLMFLPKSTDAAPDPDIANLVAQVSADSIEFTIRKLVGFDTRFIGSDSNAAASRWLGDRFQRMGYGNVRFDTFLVNQDRTYRVTLDSGEAFHRFVFQNAEQRNVIATKPGTLHQERKLVLGGHFDSISLDRTQTSQDLAPGADDNATGIAAVIEVARVLRDADLEMTVEFVLFGAEELGLIGSQDYVKRSRESGDEIQLMLTLDSIGTRSPRFPDAFSLDTIHPYAELGDLVALAADEYTDLSARNGSGGTVVITNRGCRCSDHQSFIDGGYPGIGVFQYVSNPASHLNTSVDTLGGVDITLVHGIAQAVLASAAKLGAYPGRTADFEGNGEVGFEDFVLFVEGFGGSDATYDLDRDGNVAFSDFIIFAKNYGRIFNPS